MLPPLLAGAKYVTYAVVLPVAIACPTVGAPGAIATTLEVELELAELVPYVLVPVTTQLIVDPISSCPNVYVLDVAEGIFTPMRCH